MDINRSIGLIERKVKESENWKTTDGKYVHVSYIAGSIPKAASLEKTLRMMDVSLIGDCGVLQLPLPSDRIPVYIYPGEDALRTALSMKGLASTGVSLGSWAVIVTKPTMSFGQLASSSTHEIGHAVVHKNLGLFVGSFMAEGIAYYLEAKFSNAPWLKSPKPLESTPLKQLINNASTQKDYQHAARFCGYLMLLDKNNPSRIKSLFQGLHQARVNQIRGVGHGDWPNRADQVFVGIYGKGMAAVDAGWRQRLGR